MQNANQGTQHLRNTWCYQKAYWLTANAYVPGHISSSLIEIRAIAGGSVEVQESVANTIVHLPRTVLD